MRVLPLNVPLSGLWVRIVSQSRLIVGFSDQVTWGTGDTV